LKICAITPTDQLTGTTPLSKIKLNNLECLWMNYFKEMNEVEHDHIKIVINLNEDNHDDVLNVPMSQAEIENVILNLHNDKSSGLDNVTNEPIKVNTL
jgi:hypothetical protein